MTLRCWKFENQDEDGNMCEKGDKPMVQIQCSHYMEEKSDDRFESSLTGPCRVFYFDKKEPHEF